MQTGVEFAGEREQRIPQRLEFQPTTVHPPIQPVFRIDRSSVRPIHARLPVDRRQHQFAMDRLLRPVAFQQGGGQIVERGVLRRDFGANPEITGRRHQRFAKMIHPQSIDQHAARQRIRRSDNRLGQLQTSAAATERLAFRGGGDEQKLAGHFFARPRWIATNENPRIVRLSVVGHHHRSRRRGGRVRLERVDLLAQLAFLIPFRAIQYALQVRTGEVDRPVLRNQRLGELPQVRRQLSFRVAVPASGQPRLERLLKQFPVKPRDLGAGERRSRGERRFHSRIDLALLQPLRPREQAVDHGAR